MRKSKILSATALSLSLMATAILCGTAHAQTTVSTATTTPVDTSTTGDLTVSSAGKITLPSGTAVTVSTNNNVTVAGTVEMSSTSNGTAGSADGSTAILINPGKTSNITISGTLRSIDNFTATDIGSLNTSGVQVTTTDGFIDPPYAQGNGRYGLHSLAGSALIGNIDFQTGSSVDIQGNSSYGVRLENALSGNFNSRASHSLIGDSSKAISLEGGVTGRTRIGGSISVTGKDSNAVNIGGDLGGALLFDGSIVNNGYPFSSALTTAQTAAILPVDRQMAGSAVIISGNVANGIIFDATPTTSTTNTDVDANSIPDAEQGTSAITQYGNAPAIIIGSATKDITVGLTQFTGTPDSTTSAAKYSSNAFGLVERGTIAATGLLSGVESTAIKLGGQGHNVTIAGGILVNGSVSSASLNADTRAISLQSGANVALIRVTGSVSATTTAVTTTTTTPVVTNTNIARAIDISSGATVGSIQIDAGGTILASTTGSLGNATAIRDQTNTLNQLIVNGTLSSSITATDTNADGVVDTVANHAVALDTSSNSIGLTLNSTREATGTFSVPVIIGDIKLGSGNDIINLAGSNISGDIDFGAGTNSLTLNTVTTTQTTPVTVASTVSGKLTGAGTVALDIQAGTLNLAKGSKLNTTSVHVGSTSTLSAVLDTANPPTPILNGTGAAVFDNGATLKLGLSSLLLTPTQFTLLTGSSVTIGNLKTDLTGDVPYIYTANIATDAANTKLLANFRLKTSAEANLSSNEFAALPAVLTASQSDSAAQAALLAPTDKATFLRIFSQFLPDYSGENLLSLTKGNESLSRTLASQDRLPDPGVSQYWAHENGFNVKRKEGQVTGFKSTGFTFAGGMERGLDTHQAAGLYFSYTGATPLDKFAIGKESYTDDEFGAGVYWRMIDGPLKSWARAGLGYVSLDSTRQILSTAVDRTTKAKWHGTSSGASIGASYKLVAGPFSVTPAIYGDAYNLSEQSHQEKGGGAAYDLNIAKRDSHIVSAATIVSVGTTANWVVKPEIWAGYQDNLSVKVGNTTAHFTGGQDFTLGTNLKQGGGPVAGFRLSSNTDYSYIGLEGAYEKQSGYTNTSLSLRARFQF